MEEFRPVAEGLVGRDDGAGPLVARGDKLVEEMAFLTRHRRVIGTRRIDADTFNEWAWMMGPIMP